MPCGDGGILPFWTAKNEGERRKSAN